MSRRRHLNLNRRRLREAVLSAWRLCALLGLVGRHTARYDLLTVSAYTYCIEGHLCFPCVQKTQQSPSFGLISSPHFSQLYFIVQTSVGMVSIFLCPHFGHVISDCITILLSVFVESLAQQESLGFLLSEVMASFFVGVEQCMRRSVPIMIEKCLIVCILCCLTGRPALLNLTFCG